MNIYEIIVESHIDRKRLRAFEGLDFKHLPDGKTLIYGTLKDQTELFAVINKIRDMNLKLLLIKKNNEEMEDGV